MVSCGLLGLDGGASPFQETSPSNSPARRGSCYTAGQIHERNAPLARSGANSAMPKPQGPSVRKRTLGRHAVGSNFAAITTKGMDNRAVTHWAAARR